MMLMPLSQPLKLVLYILALFVFEVDEKHHLHAHQQLFQLKVSVHVLNYLSQFKMATKVKGLFKGLRYISNIFDEKDQEIQIGFPTDVKHVAHIGWDGPSANNNTPSWMGEFKSSAEVSSAGQLTVKELSSQEIIKTGLAVQELVQRNEIPKSRRQSSSGSPGNSPTKKSSDGSNKHSRRHRSTEAGLDSSAREGSSRHARRSRNSNNLGSESPSQDPPGVPKQRRKKGSSEGGSSRSSRRRSKGQHSLTDISLEGSEHGLKNSESQMNSALVEVKGSEGISGGNN